MVRCVLSFAVLAATCLVIPAQGEEERVLCGKFRLAPGTELSLSDMERRLVCGDPKSKVWAHIPDNQAMFFLRSFLQARGHHTPRFDAAGATIVIHPGEPTYVNTFTVVGVPPDFHAERLRRITYELLTPKLLNSVSERIVARLRQQGYPCADVKVSAGYSDGNIVAVIRAGPLQNFASFWEDTVPGVAKGAFSRHHAFHLGDRYDSNLLALTRMRVLAEGAVQGTHFETTCPEPGAAVIQKFVPGPPRLVTLGFGIDTERLFILRASWRDARVGANASSLEAMLTMSWREQEIRGMSRLYLFPESRWHFRPSVGIKRRNEIPFEEWHADFQSSVATTWDNSLFRISASLGPQLHLSRVARGKGTQPSSEYMTFSTEWRLLTHDFELNAAAPRSGLDMKFNLDSRFSGVVSDVEAHAIRFTFAKLWNVGNFDPAWIVIGLRGGFSTTLASDAVIGGSRLPPEFRHYLGGSTDLRGFARKQLPSEQRNGAGTVFHLGVEARLADLLPHGIQPFIFIDVGKLGKKSLQLEGATFLSPGVGLRWQLPFGALRATVARGMVLGGGDNFGGRSQWTFFLNLGEEF